MFIHRPSSTRGKDNLGWLDSRHTFSFGRYYDPKHMGFRALRVINEDVVAPAKGFGAHPHDNMEIVTYVLSGALAHNDSLGSVKTLTPGELQRMSAGTGIEHSEFNPSPTEPVHFLQIWLEPDRQDQPPSYEQKTFPLVGRQGRPQLLASPTGEEGSLRIGADARLSSAVLTPGQRVHISLRPGRHAYVQIARGSMTLAAPAGGPAGELALAQGDGVAVSEEPGFDLIGATSATDSEALIFDLA
jgi:hypothetical protein